MEVDGHWNFLLDESFQERLHAMLEFEVRFFAVEWNNSKEVDNASVVELQRRIKVRKARHERSEQVCWVLEPIGSGGLRLATIDDGGSYHESLR